LYHPTHKAHHKITNQSILHICTHKNRELKIELAPNKSKLLPKNNPHRTEPFLLNLKKDKKYTLNVLYKALGSDWQRAVFEWVREVVPGLYYFERSKLFVE